jgi:MoaA/NifB/PqqE/SkfB family radical SAM enzyme
MINTFNNLNPLVYKPRLIIWNISPKSTGGSRSNSKPLSIQECFSVMDSIAELAKPIIVLSTDSCRKLNNDSFDRPDIIDLILYGNSLGFKMIVETCGHKLTKDMRNILRTIGTKSIRVLLHDRVKESIDDGFLQSEEFSDLDQRLHELKANGFEIHLGLNSDVSDYRSIAFAIDYSVRKNAKGIYFHMSKNNSVSGKNIKPAKNTSTPIERESLIMWIAKQKRLLPEEMNFSPQCVRYGIRHREDLQSDVSNTENHHSFHHGIKPQIGHWCLGGKTFAYITNSGRVQICHDLQTECGDLRKCNYNFVEIWNKSKIFSDVRNSNFTCLQTQNFITKFYKNKLVHDDIAAEGYSELFQQQH